MEIANEFSLGLPLERAWPLLTNLERIAPAMPGVTVDGVEGDALRATMRVKVGPIGVTYRAVVTVVSADPAANTVVLRASGREARGSGTVEATITALLRTVEDAPERTAVDLLTDVAVTGRVAQFGGGVMREVADRLLRQFARRLEQQLVEQPELAELAASATPEAATAAATPVGAAPAAAAGAAPSAAAPAAARPTPAPAPRPAAPAPAASAPALAGVSAFAGALLGALFGALLAALLLRAGRDAR